MDRLVICPIVIGRENELQVLSRLIGHSHENHGHVALISGEAGIGKSRLVKEAKSFAPENTIIIEGYCFQAESSLPYAPLIDLFRNLFSTYPSMDISRKVGRSVSHLVKLFPEFTDHVLDAEPGLNTDPKQEKHNIFHTLLRILGESAQERSLVIVIEDLHWSDSTSLEFLLLLARRISSIPISLLLTYRSDETTPELTHFLAELDRERLCTEVPLKRMSLQEVDALVRAIPDLKTPVGKEFLYTLFELTEGNPFFIEEILKSLSGDGNLLQAIGRWKQKEIIQLSIPRTIQDAVQRRIQKLDEQTRRTLTFASVMGRRFDFRLLQELLQANEEDLLKTLKKLVEAQLVVEETADQFAFRHALTREAIYATLLHRERQGLHQSVGEAIERLYTNTINSHLADLSYHYYTGGVWHKALEYSQKAGEQASFLYAQREAIVFYSRALVSARQLNTVSAPELLRARGLAYEILGDFKSALDDFEHGLRIAQNSGTAEWQILIDLGSLWAGRDYQKAGEYFHRAEELARDLNETKLQAHSLNRLGNWSVNTGQTLQGLQSHRQALEIFQHTGDEQGMADTYDLLGMASMQHGDLIRSYEEYQHAIRLFRKLGNRHGLISALTGASNTINWDETTLTPSQSRSQSVAMVTEALELAQQIGWSAGQSFAEWGLAIGLSNQGVFNDALTYANDSLRVAAEIGHHQWTIGAHYALGHSYILMLQGERAIQILEAGLVLARELGSAWWIDNIITDLANAYVLENSPHRARVLLEQVQQTNKDHLTIAERRRLFAKGNVLLAEQRPAEALQIIDSLMNAVSEHGTIRPIPALLKLKGEALMALKQWDQALYHLGHATQAAQQREAYPLLWQIHRRMGELYRVQKHLEESDKEFTHASRIIQTLSKNIPDEEMQIRFLRKALEDLPKEGQISKRKQEAKLFGGLTLREREVARCLSEGKSNREIAEELVLSERTIENHVGNILRKLGFDSRAQVAVWVVEKGLLKN